MTLERYRVFLVHALVSTAVALVVAALGSLGYAVVHWAITPAVPDPPPPCVEYAGVYDQDDGVMTCTRGHIETSQAGPGQVLVVCRCGGPDGGR